ncbi:MAG: alpha-E domain-containing protein [Planctomycetaceae bacterium]|nr:alpha-E domain-containing protein [Planctomycetaceae bacterium]
MLSRVAESIYWMSRYIERAENVARFIDVNLNLALDLGPEMERQWNSLIYTTGDEVLFQSRYRDATQQNVIQFLTLDDGNPNSILSCLQRARENARTVRDMISSPMWEELNKYYLLLRSASPAQVLNAPIEFFQRIILTRYTLDGATQATMSHTEAWHFHRLGQMIERADKTSRILDVKYYILLPEATDVGTPIDANQWAALLKSASALEMYRKAHGRITPAQVAEFLILNRDFPRAMRFCLIRGEQSLLSITGGASGTFRNRAEQRLGRLRSELDYSNIDEIMQSGLHEFVDRFQNRLNAVGEAVSETFFAVKPVEGVRPRPSAPQSETQVMK